MQITRIHVRRWRNFANIDADIPADARLVCLVGDNGTGKSNLLELISAAAHHVGISAGIPNRRGNPLREDHDVQITFNTSPNMLADIRANISPGLREHADAWNGEIRFESSCGPDQQGEPRLSAGGIADANRGHTFISNLSPILRARKTIHHLHLDADRAYPRKEMPPHEYAEGLGRDWTSAEWTSRRAYLPSHDMYDDWMKYFLAIETQMATRRMQEERVSQSSGVPMAVFVDHFQAFREGLRRVLPHLQFEAINSVKRTIMFNSSGVQLPFSSLSGGEREIAFLIGQIDRFQLRSGLLLLDEPELHLNPDLFRNWLAYLRDTVEEGQVWMATHTLEAVEIAGSASTFVLERNAQSRVVERLAPLGSRRVLRVLATALGSPAFSLANKRFIYIEGERENAERERFYRLCDQSPQNRFIQAGNCREVVRSYRSVLSLAAETDEQLCVGAVIDRDFRVRKDLRKLIASDAIFALPCHEVENLFLHPESLQVHLNRTGWEGEPASTLIREASDRFAGAWIHQISMQRSTENVRSNKMMKQHAWTLPWSRFATDLTDAIDSILDREPDWSSADRASTHNVMSRYASFYGKLRLSPNLWLHVFGKQVLGELASRIGIRSGEILERYICHLWQQGLAERPTQVRALINYIAGVGNPVD